MLNDYTLRFDAKTVDYIANVLAQRPYGEVAEVLRSLSEQMRAQQPGMPVMANGAAAAASVVEQAQ